MHIQVLDVSVTWTMHRQQDIGGDDSASLGICCIMEISPAILNGISKVLLIDPTMQTWLLGRALV